MSSADRRHQTKREREREREREKIRKVNGIFNDDKKKRPSFVKTS